MRMKGFILVILCVHGVLALPEQGAFEVTMNQSQNIAVFTKSMYNSTSIAVKIHCNQDESVQIRISWLLRWTPCAQEYGDIDSEPGLAQAYFTNPEMLRSDLPYQYVKYQKYSEETISRCSSGEYIQLTDKSADGYNLRNGTRLSAVVPQKKSADETNAPATKDNKSKSRSKREAQQVGAKSIQAAVTPVPAMDGSSYNLSSSGNVWNISLENSLTNTTSVIQNGTNTSSPEAIFRSSIGSNGTQVNISNTDVDLNITVIRVNSTYIDVHKTHLHTNVTYVEYGDADVQYNDTDIEINMSDVGVGDADEYYDYADDYDVSMSEDGFPKYEPLSLNKSKFIMKTNEVSDPNLHDVDDETNGGDDYDDDDKSMVDKGYDEMDEFLKNITVDEKLSYGNQTKATTNTIEKNVIVSKGNEQILKSVDKFDKKANGKSVLGDEDNGIREDIKLDQMYNTNQASSDEFHRVTTTWEDGIYLFIIKIDLVNEDSAFSATVDVRMKRTGGGFLSAIEWPLLPFYGAMCVVYVIFGIIWLVLSACNWRDLLRIQFWIGGVIFLGMLEKAVFFSEHESIDSTGRSVHGAMLFGELVSCLKRTLARMLVIIVSLGFGIVKPRLGPMLHKVLAIGGLYFILSAVEGCLRVVKPKSDQSNQAMLAAIPLAVLDAAICWWIFTGLVGTIRTLRLRRNLVKLSLYRHFTNTLIFAVIASVAFMVWSITQHKFTKCLSDWKELWVDEAFWHLLFSVILMVIMILWRPSANNQRYAFSPLMDAADDEAVEPMMNDAFDGMKMRGVKGQNGSPVQKEKSKADEDLKWIDENIPASVADTALPSLLDSDEEMMNTKYEMSKME